MDTQKIHNLSEAYLQVYREIDEAKVDDKLSPEEKRDVRNERRFGKAGKGYFNPVGTAELRRGLHKSRRGVTKEEVDIYDIVLSHLLDEGYAETEKAAEAIVENMSEEWINFVIETKLGFAAQKIANIARSKGDTNKEKQARRLATKQFSSAADPAKHGKANVNRARQQAKQRQERQPEDRYDDHPSLSARERNPNLR